MEIKKLLLIVTMVYSLSSCGNGQNNDVVQVTQGSQEAFQAKFSDFYSGSSVDGQKTVWIRGGSNDQLAKVMTFDPSQPVDQSRQYLFQKGRGEELKDDEAREASISHDGSFIATILKGDQFKLIVSNFSGTTYQEVNLGFDDTRKLESVVWATNHSVFVVGSIQIDEEGRVSNYWHLVHVATVDQNLVVTPKEQVEGQRPRLSYVNNQNYVVFLEQNGATDQFSAIPYTLSDNQITIDFAAKTSKSLEFSLLDSAPIFANSFGLSYVTRSQNPEERKRLGNRKPAVDGSDNIGKIIISEPLTTLALPNFDNSEILDFSGYQDLEPVSALSVSTNSEGDFVLVVGTQYLACESLDLAGTVMHLVNRTTQTAFPIVPILNISNLTGSTLTSNPCESNDAINNKTLDLKITSAQLIKKSATSFVIVYETNYFRESEIFKVEFQAPNIGTQGLTWSDLVLENVVFTNISENYIASGRI